MMTAMDQFLELQTQIQRAYSQVAPASAAQRPEQAA
jgi:hypothetical protein